jgi:pimeloyl-ACP methyl ester carboxylesterase
MPAELLQPRRLDIGGGRRLNFRCVGSGSPTVVFEQGGEGFISNWAKVQPAVSALTRTCVYDRAGFGYSDPPDQPVTAISVTDDLRAALDKAGLRQPVVLAGHSVGGFYATMFANRFPARVAGLVLVDPGFSGQELLLSTQRQLVVQANIRRGEGYLMRCAALARERALTADNLAQNRCITPPAGSTPEEMRYIVHAITRPHWYEAEHSQSVNYFSGDAEPSVSHAQEMKASRSFGDLPMIVLSREKVLPAPWRTAEENEAGLRNWLAGHQKLAARSSRGRWTVVPGSDHFIQKDKPQAVIDAIAEVVAAARLNERTR